MKSKEPKPKSLKEKMYEQTFFYQLGIPMSSMSWPRKRPSSEKFLRKTPEIEPGSQVGKKDDPRESDPNPPTASSKV